MYPFWNYEFTTSTIGLHADLFWCYKVVFGKHNFKLGLGKVQSDMFLS